MFFALCSMSKIFEKMIILKSFDLVLKKYGK